MMELESTYTFILVGPGVSVEEVADIQTDIPKALLTWLLSVEVKIHKFEEEEHI